MRHENEIVDGRLMMRIICGLLAVGGLWAIGSAVLRLVSERPVEWSSLLMPAAALYGTYLLGRYALTGHLALRGPRGDGD